REEEREGDRGIEVATGDVAERGDHQRDGEAVSECDSDQIGAQGNCADADEDQCERADELGNSTLAPAIGHRAKARPGSGRWDAGTLIRWPRPHRGRGRSRSSARIATRRSAGSCWPQTRLGTQASSARTASSSSPTSGRLTTTGSRSYRVAPRLPIGRAWQSKRPPRLLPCALGRSCALAPP